MASTVPFVKRYTSPEELVTLLRGRGLGIADARKAAHYLAHIGYYRLSAYMYPLLAQPKALLSTVSPGNDMGDKLNTLLAAFPDVDPAAMGFPEGWEDEPLWRE